VIEVRHYDAPERDLRSLDGRMQITSDKATADAIFGDYLAGKLSEELLSISRRWVSADQAGSSKGEIERNGAAQRQLREHAAGGVGVRDEAFTAVA
jgi:hypothetical protein